MVPDSHSYVFPFESLCIATAHCGHRFIYIASPIPVPTQVISSGCYAMITKGSVRSVNYVLILPFYIGQFSVCSLEYIYMAHRHRLVTLSIMSVQAYKYCESTCSDPRTNIPLPVTNTVVDRTSYSDFIRLVFFTMVGSLFLHLLSQ